MMKLIAWCFASDEEKTFILLIHTVTNHERKTMKVAQHEHETSCTHRMTQTLTLLFWTTFPLTPLLRPAPPSPPSTLFPLLWYDVVLLVLSHERSSSVSSPRDVLSRSNSSSKIDLFLSVPTKWKAALLSLGGVADDWRVMVIWGLWLRELSRWSWCVGERRSPFM